jgi:hemerythrin-like domain-containing protein
MTDTISAYMTADHRRCDRLLTNAESAVGRGEWGLVVQSVADLGKAMVRHFALEEEVLFPELEKVAPGAGGPASVMRIEHLQVRSLLTELDGAVEAEEPGEVLGNLETLLMLLQQHNAKEEAILYPLADRALAGAAEDLLERMGMYGAAA